MTLFNYLLVLIISKTILKSKLHFQNICLFSIGFVIAVMDRAHLKLKMEYKQKKKVQKKLEFAVEKNLYYKVINILNNFHCRKTFQVIHIVNVINQFIELDLGL